MLGLVSSAAGAVSADALGAVAAAAVRPGAGRRAAALRRACLFEGTLDQARTQACESWAMAPNLCQAAPKSQWR
jgi:hypothetical protein